jgi:hypothetical protein
MTTHGPDTLGHCPCGAALVPTTCGHWICPRCFLGLTPGADGAWADLPRVLVLDSPGGDA